MNEINKQQIDYEISDNGNSVFKTVNDFIIFIEKFKFEEIDLPFKALDNEHNFLSAAEIESNYISIFKSIDGSGSSDMVLTVVCAYILGAYPELQTWKNVKEISWNSWEVENWLESAVIAYATIKDEFKNSYISLGSKVCDELANDQLKSKSDRVNTERANNVKYWEASDTKLEDIWEGLRNANFMNYDEDILFFKILNEFSPEIFSNFICSINNPYLLQAILIQNGSGVIDFDFSKWSEYTTIAPTAFNKDGSWTGSILMPLVLNHAYLYIHEFLRNIDNNVKPLVHLSELNRKVKYNVECIVKVIGERGDSSTLFSRWGTWIMRKILTSNEQVFEDIRSHSFTNFIIIDEMGKHIEGYNLIKNSPQDANPWETMSYYCLRSYLASKGFINPLNFDEFVNSWEIEPEDWNDDLGKELVEEFKPYLFKKEYPGILASLTVLPLANTREFFLTWQTLWDKACYLREVVEFGSIDYKESAYSDRTDSSKLLLFIGCVGLACFDEVADRLTEVDEELKVEVINLFSAITTACVEMLNIDTTINRSEWLIILKYLGLRRAYWDSNYNSNCTVSIFDLQSAPKITYYLNSFKSNSQELLRFIHALQANNFDKSAIVIDIQNADIDLLFHLDLLKELNELNSYRYPLDHQTISSVKLFIDN